jgi:hypothetical protein
MLELTARTLVELRLCLLRPHRRGGAAEELRPLPLPFGGGRPQGGEGVVRRRSSGQSRKGAQRVEQRREGGAAVEQRCEGGRDRLICSKAELLWQPWPPAEL